MLGKNYKKQDMSGKSGTIGRQPLSRILAKLNSVPFVCLFTEPTNAKGLLPICSKHNLNKSIS